VGIAGYVARDHEAVNAVDFFDLLAFHRGACNEACAAGNVYEANGVEIGMNFVFHSTMTPKGLALLGLEAGIGFIDDVNAAFSADDFAVGVARFQRLDG